MPKPELKARRPLPQPVQPPVKVEQPQIAIMKEEEPEPPPDDEEPDPRDDDAPEDQEGEGEEEEVKERDPLLFVEAKEEPPAKRRRLEADEGQQWPGRQAERKQGWKATTQDWQGYRGDRTKPEQDWAGSRGWQGDSSEDLSWSSRQHPGPAEPESGVRSSWQHPWTPGYDNWHWTDPESGAASSWQHSSPESESGAGGASASHAAPAAAAFTPVDAPAAAAAAAAAATPSSRTVEFVIDVYNTHLKLADSRIMGELVQLATHGHGGFEQACQILGAVQRWNPWTQGPLRDPNGFIRSKLNSARKEVGLYI